MNTSTATSPDAFRAEMVDHILAAGHAESSHVEAALREVPRHLFVPAAPVQDAYADIAVVTKRSGDGSALSCASVPTVVAMMLDQLAVVPGGAVLEIGAGTGYNAALLDHLTGPDGRVTTVDIDPEVTAQARHALDATGHGDVSVITRDGALGAEEHGEYDRIIFTVGAWDIPPAIWSQLKPGGRLVVPLRWRGQTRSVAFVRDHDRLRSDSIELCGFVPMIGQDGESTGVIDADGLVSLFWDSDQPVDPNALNGVLATPRTDAWSGVTVFGNEPFDGIWLRLAGTEPGTCRIAAEPAAIQTGLCTPAIGSRSPAIVDGASLAYLTVRPRHDDTAERRWELGATGHGPAGLRLAERLGEQIRGWSQDRTARPVLTVHPAGTPHRDLPAGLIVDKGHSRLVASLHV